jgi:hypothetical protein
MRMFRAKKEQGEKEIMNIGKFVWLGFLLIAAGCLRDEPMDSNKVKRQGDCAMLGNLV